MKHTLIILTALVLAALAALLAAESMSAPGSLPPLDAYEDR